MNITTKATSGHQHHEHAHHHHHRHHKDDAESFKQQSLRVRKRRKTISRVLFVTLSILAAIIIIACLASNWLFWDWLRQRLLLLLCKRSWAGYAVAYKGFPERQYHLSPSRKERNKNIRIQKKAVSPESLWLEELTAVFLSVCQARDVWLRIIPKRSSGCSM